MANSGLLHSLQAAQKEKLDRQRAIESLIHKRSIFERRLADQEVELTKKTKPAQNDSGSTNVDSKDEATLQMAELEEKSLELERRILNEEWTNKIQYFTEKISKTMSLRKSDQDSGAEQIKELMLENDNIRIKNDADNEEMLQNYSYELNQSIQGYQLSEMNLKEQISLNLKSNEESENCTSKIEQLEIILQDLSSALNQSKDSFDEWSKELEISFNQATEELKMVQEALQTAEENGRIAREEVSILADSKNLLLSEEVHSQEELFEEEAFLSDLQLKKSAALESKTDLIQRKEELDQQIDGFEKGNLAIDQDCALLEKENACLVEEIQQKTAHYDEVLSDAKVTIEEIASQVANLESDLIFTNKIISKLNAEVENNAFLLTENAETEKKSSSLTTSEEDLVKKLELSNQNLKNLSDELKSYSEELCVKTEKLSTLSKEREAEVDSSKKKHFKVTGENEGRSSLLFVYTERRSDLRSNTDKLTQKMIADAQEKEKTINQTISEDNEKMDRAKKNFKNLYDSFSLKYKEKRNRLRKSQVQLANLAEKLEKAKKTEADIHQMLVNKLKADSSEADSTTIPTLGPKRIKFSAQLEKFSPQLSSASTHQTPKSILKRKNETNLDETPKKPKTENTDTNNYFPSFSDK